MTQLTEEDIKRFRVGDILFSDEQAKMFCDLALKGLRAQAVPSAGTVHSMTGICPTCGSDAYEALSPSATTATEWTRPEERLPEIENFGRVLVLLGHTHHVAEVRANDGGVWLGAEIYPWSCIAYWMPLPELPK